MRTQDLPGMARWQLQCPMPADLSHVGEGLPWPTMITASSERMVDMESA
jgi:hypothetical protein